MLFIFRSEYIYIKNQEKTIIIKLNKKFLLNIKREIFSKFSTFLLKKFKKL